MKQLFFLRIGQGKIHLLANGHFLRRLGLERSGHAGDLDASGKCANWRSNVRRQLRLDHARSDIGVEHASIFLLQNYPKKPELILRQQSVIEIFCVTTLVNDSTCLRLLVLSLGPCMRVVSWPEPYDHCMW